MDMSNPKYFIQKQASDNEDKILFRSDNSIEITHDVDLSLTSTIKKETMSVLSPGMFPRDSQNTVRLSHPNGDTGRLNSALCLSNRVSRHSTIYNKRSSEGSLGTNLSNFSFESSNTTTQGTENLNTKNLIVNSDGSPSLVKKPMSFLTVTCDNHMHDGVRRTYSRCERRPSFRRPNRNQSEEAQPVCAKLKSPHSLTHKISPKLLRSRQDTNSPSRGGTTSEDGSIPHSASTKGLFPPDDSTPDDQVSSLPIKLTSKSSERLTDSKEFQTKQLSRTILYDREPGQSKGHSCYTTPILKRKARQLTGNSSEIQRFCNGFHTNESLPVNFSLGFKNENYNQFRRGSNQVSIGKQSNRVLLNDEGSSKRKRSFTRNKSKISQSFGSHLQSGNYRNKKIIELKQLENSKINQSVTDLIKRKSASAANLRRMDSFRRKNSLTSFGKTNSPLKSYCRSSAGSLASSINAEAKNFTFKEKLSIGAAPLVAAMRQKKQPRVPRFMQKNGHCNIRKSASEKRRRYMSDFFTTMVDLKWSYSLLVFLSFYLMSWIVLSFLYWLIAYFRDQLWSENSRSKQVLNAHNPCIASHEDKRCFYNVDSYMRMFLFFIETDQTIGYGRRAISHHCPEAMVLFVFQCLYATLLDAFIMGCIFIKVSKPNSNRNTQLIFTENACICQRDGKNCLMFRVGNLRDSLIVQCRIRAKLIKSRQTPEGEFIPLDQSDINLGFDNGSDKLFLVTPLIVTHVIDERSPLWEYSYDKMRNDQFEIIVILEGTVESTGAICQARTSYLNTEIIWGHRFNPLLFMDTAGRKDEKFRADLRLFNSTYEVPIPKISAKELKDQEDMDDSFRNGPNNNDSFTINDNPLEDPINVIQVNNLSHTQTLNSMQNENNSLGDKVLSFDELESVKSRSKTSSKKDLRVTSG